MKKTPKHKPQEVQRKDTETVKMHVSYYNTNESLDAIVMGLTPNQKDKILCVGGSGDQAFALIAEGSEVICVDCDEGQVAYIKMRASHLKEGWFDKFFSPERASASDYFLKSDRLEKMRSNIEMLKIMKGNAIEIATGNETFTKMYLSNVIGDQYDAGLNAFRRIIKLNDFRHIMQAASENIPVGGLIYITNHDRICKEIKPQPAPRGAWNFIQNGTLHPIPNPSWLLPDNLVIDCERSTIARKKENEKNSIWEPAVYRRVR